MDIDQFVVISTLEWLITITNIKKMNSSVVREKFFQYFKDKGHEIIPSASVINKTDKNLMFTNAGMNQFRNIFTGEQNSKFPKVANSQK